MDGRRVAQGWPKAAPGRSKGGPGTTQGRPRGGPAACLGMLGAAQGRPRGSLGPIGGRRQPRGGTGTVTELSHRVEDQASKEAEDEDIEGY
jgi:hypothetical protein